MKQLLRITIWLFAGIFLLLLGVVIYIQSPTGQDFLTKRVVSYLRVKTKTKIEIEKVRFDFPDWISIENVYIEDTQRDTLLAGKRLYVDIDMMALLQNKAAINKIELENIRLKVSRTLPDTTFNFDFLLKAFDSGSQTPQPDTKPFDVSLQKVTLKNVNITYKDAIIGTDADANFNFLETFFDKFNLAKSQYHFQKINGNNGSLVLKMYQPLLVSATKKTEKLTADTLDFQLKKLDLSGINWLFESAVDGIKNTGKLNKIELVGDKFYLEKQQLSFKKILLDKTETYLELVKNNKKTPNTEQNTTTSSSGWAINVDKFEIKNNAIRFDDFNGIRQAKGFDVAHVSVKNLGLSLNNFIFKPNQISGQLRNTAFTERSGITVKNISTDFSYTDKQMSLQKLLVQTPNTVLRDELLMQYNSVDDFSKNLGNVGIKLNLKTSQLAVNDLFLLVPDLVKNPTFKNRNNDIIKVDGLILGKINNLLLSKVTVNGFGDTRLQAKGRIVGLPNLDKLVVDVEVGELSVSKNDMLAFAPENTIPTSIELPERLSIKGMIKGKIQDLVLDAALDSDFGSGSFKGNLKNITADKNQTYDGRITLQDFDLERLTKQPKDNPMVGKISIDANIKGVGFDPKTMNTVIDGTAQKAQINGYEYNNLALKGSITDQIANFDASVNDPNAKVNISARVNLADEFPAIKGNVKIEELSLKKLNLYAEDIKIKGDITADLQSTNPENPLGEIFIKNAIIQKNGNEISLDTVNIDIKNIQNRRNINLKSPFLQANINGNFVYTQLADILLTEANKYFALPEIPYKAVQTPYDFVVSATLRNHPVIQSFVPNVGKFDPINFDASLNSQQDTTLQASLFVPYAEYDTSSISNGRFKIFGVKNQAHYQGNIAQVLYDEYRFRRLFLGGNIANNVLSINLLAKDSLNVNRYGFAGNLRSVDKKLRLNLTQKGTLIDYKTWEADSTGFAEYSSEGVYINHLLLNQNRQRLSINSQYPEPNSPLTIKIDSLNITPFITLATQDSTLAGGTLNGLFQLKNYMTTPEFTGDLMVRNFIFTQIPIGNMSLNATNEANDRIKVLGNVLGNGNDIQADGQYFLNRKKPLDFKINIKKISTKTIEAFSFGQLKNARGSLTGLLNISGEPTKPVFDGNVKFDTVAFSLAMLGATYRIDNQQLNFKNSIIGFDKFTVTDTLGQKMLVNGSLSLQNIPNFNYKLNIASKNFMVLNGSRKDNDFFYGKGFVDANLNVRGIGTKPAIEGSVKVKEGSDITVLLPDREINKAETEGIVAFVDLKNPTAENTVQTDSSDLTSTFDFAEEISLNIDVDDKSQLTIIVDELNGDNIRVKGNAQLNTGITPSGQPFVLGLYELSSGSYDLSFQFLKKQFDIEKGSTLLWTGDPMQAQVDITAIFKIEAEIPRTIATTKSIGKIPLEVLLKMNGNLSNPTIDFDIRVPETASPELSNAIKNDGYLETLRRNSVEMNKQVFALLVLNKFLTEQSTDFFSGINPEAIARQSVSKLLTDQLNLLAGDLIKGINLDFKLNSTTTGSDAGVVQARTDLNVGLSKAFLNDRLKVSVGRNFQLENTTGAAANTNSIVDNISLNYKLSADGRYLFSAYRKNQYQAILDGFVVETGVAFTVTLDYEYFKELFEKKK